MKNLFAVILSFVTYIVTFFVSHLFFGLIGYIDIIRSVFRWPISYETNMVVAAYLISIELGCIVSDKVGRCNKKGKKPAVIGYGILLLLYQLSCLICNVLILHIENVSVWGYVVAIVESIIVISAGFFGADTT